MSVRPKYKTLIKMILHAASKISLTMKPTMVRDRVRLLHDLCEEVLRELGGETK